MAVAYEPHCRTMTPLHLRLGSSEAPDFMSENPQVLEVMHTLHEAAGGRDIFVYDLEDIRLLDGQRLKNMMGILLVALYFLSVHLGPGLRLEILAGHIVAASKHFDGVTEFCDYALADGGGALLSRISPKKEESSPKESQQDLLPGFS